MPIRDYNDAVEVERAAGRIFDASPDGRAAEIRGLFVEVLDFASASGLVALPGVKDDPVLPVAAERIAELDGFHVIYVPLKPSGPDRVRKGDVDRAARLIADQIGEDVLLVFTNPSASQVHVVLPDFTKSSISLRRMVVERDLPRRTAVQQVSNIYWRYQASGSIRTALGEAFDVGPVTKEFFEEYERLHEMAIERLQGFGTDGEDEEQRKLFVQTLFNRLMFIYFLSRKGWLSFPTPDGEVDFDYLNALWRDYSARDEQNKNFHIQRLSLLFFAGLNNPQCRDLSVNNPVVYSLIGNVPFLNGGLFEESDLDKRQDVLVPDDVIEQILSKLFNRFNFTVMESTPLDIEVAVDPEMLGKVFEELVTGRHDSGSYYTPRTVVSFMCREALKGYLEGRDTGATTEALTQFVDRQDTSKLDVASARRISSALAEVKVVDPACGSGAYLLGMMQELIELQTTLFNAGVDAKALYDLKLEIIQHNLYGVDIDEFATNVAMLRLWLSLAIDYEGEKLEPLPNLDFKIIRGDSLLGPDPEQLTLSRHLISTSNLAELKSEFMRATTEKELLRGQVASAEEQLRSDLAVEAVSDGVVDWRIEFAEVFAERDGFDIAIANPPYVRHENIKPKPYKDELGRVFSEGVTARSDLYCYFYVRALQVLRPRGLHIFVCSNTWLDTQYGGMLQRYLLANARIHTIYESAVERQFSTAAINTIISVLEKAITNPEYEALFVSFRNDFELASQDPDLRFEMKVPNHDLLSAPPGGGQWGGKYLRAPEIYRQLIANARSSGLCLKDVARGERYLNTGGADGFFVLKDVSAVESELMSVTISSKEGKAWGSPTFLIEKDFLRPGYRNTHVGQIVISDPDCYVLAIPPNIDVRQYEVSKFIAWGEQAGFHLRSVTMTQTPWWRPPLQAVSAAPLLWPRTHSDTHGCYYNPNGLISLRFFRIHPKRSEDILPILGILNSTVFALLKEIHGRRGLGQGALETGLVDVMPLPFPELSRNLMDTLTDVTQPLLHREIGPLQYEVTRADRRNLDEVVLQAYGLGASSVEDLYEAVLHLVEMRAQKAKSLS